MEKVLALEVGALLALLAPLPGALMISRPTQGFPGISVPEVCRGPGAGPGEDSPRSNLHSNHHNILPQRGLDVVCCC